MSFSSPPRHPATELVSALATYCKIGWWGLVAPRAERKPLVVVQGVVLGEGGVLLAIRGDLRGWELPGGTPEPGETYEASLRREIREETGIAVEVGRHVGDYVRTGFRPHTAKVYVCKPVGGALSISSETRGVRWFDPSRPPSTLFPWYREPLADACRDAGPVLSRTERQGFSAIRTGVGIDLRMRLSGDRAGSGE